jgi:hypothetical protein
MNPGPTELGEGARVPVRDAPSHHAFTLASPEVDQGTHGLNPELDQDSRVLHLIYIWGDLLLADLLLGMPV